MVFEMVQQLHAAGETVALVGFLDTIEYQYRERLRGTSGARWQRWEMRINRLKKGGRNYVREAIKSFVERMAYRIFGKLDRPLPQRFSTLPKVNGFAMSQYRPTVYPGQLVIFRSVNREETFENDELLGWGGLAVGGIEVFDITGTHLEMLYEPNVRVLAEKLRSCLDRARASRWRRRPRTLYLQQAKIEHFHFHGLQLDRLVLARQFVRRAAVDLFCRKCRGHLRKPTDKTCASCSICWRSSAGAVSGPWAVPSES